MKKKYWFSVILLIVSMKLSGQEIRVNNNFIIVINNKVIETVAGLRLILSDSSGKEETLNGGYLPGELYVKTLGEKNMIYADSVKVLTLKFDVYEASGENEIIHNYSIGINKNWFKQSFILLKISDINTKRGTYKYSFEVPGVYFPNK